MDESLRDIAAKNNILLTATIELTNKCNFKCEHCYLVDRSCEIDIHKVFLTIEELRNCGVLYLTLTGGEIFLYKEIIQVIRYARKLGMSVTLLTNLSLLNKELINQLKELYVSEISTTIFSMNSEVNDSITKVEGSLEKILENVWFVKKAGISLEIKTPIMKKNIDDVKGVKEFCEKNGFKFNYTSEIVSRLDGDDSPVQLYAEIEKISQVLYHLNYEETSKDKFGFKPESSMCNAMKHNVSITCNGEVEPCICFPISYGSIYDSTIEDIWNNSMLKKKLISIKNKELTECVKCEYSDICLRCPGIAYSECQNYFGCAPQAKLTAMALQRIKKYQE